MNIMTKQLLNIQKELSEIIIKKRGYNAWLKHEYVTFEDLIQPVREVCIKHGVLMTFEFKLTERGMRATIKLIGTEELKNIIDDIQYWENSIEIPTNALGNDVQKIGGTITYLKRYLIMNSLLVFGCEGSSDLDSLPPSKIETKKERIRDQRDISKDISKKIQNRLEQEEQEKKFFRKRRI